MKRANMLNGFGEKGTRAGIQRPVPPVRIAAKAQYRRSGIVDCLRVDTGNQPLTCPIGQPQINDDNIGARSIQMPQGTGKIAGAA